MNDQLPDVAQQIAHFEARLREDPGSRVFLPLADLYRRSGELEHARDLLRRGIDEHPGFLAAQTALGVVENALGDGDRARVILDAVLTSDPDNLVALELLVDDASERGDWERVHDLAGRLLRLTPEDQAARDALRQARQRMAPADTAEPAATAAAAAGSDDRPPSSVPPTMPTAAMDYRAFETPTLAELYLRQGHLDKARRIVERILAADPSRKDAQDLLARIEDRGVENRGADASPSDAATAEEAAAEAEPQRARPRAPQVRPTGVESRDLDRFRAWLDTAASADS